MTTPLQRFDDWVTGRSHSLTHPLTHSPRPITVRRSSSLGDCLAATYIAHELLLRGHSVQFQAIPAMHPLLKRVTFSHSPTLPLSHSPTFEITDVPKNTFPDVNLDGAYETDPLRAERHFADMFLDTANRQLAKLGLQIGSVSSSASASFRRRAINFAPKIQSDPVAAQAALASLQSASRSHQSSNPIIHQSGPRRPWTMICPKSWSWANRTIPTPIWAEAAPQIPGTKFWLSNDAAPKGIVDLKCKTVESLVEFIALADLLLSVDSGPAHVAAAIGTPMIVIEQQSDPELHFSNQVDFRKIQPMENP